MAKKKAKKVAASDRLTPEQLKILSKRVRRNSRNQTIQDGFNDVVTHTKDLDAFRAMTSVSEFRKRLLFTGHLEWDLNLRPVMGSRIQIEGDEHMGKSLFSYILLGAVQRTCRQCFTPIIQFVDDKTGEVATTCACGDNDHGRVLLVDAEKDFDPAWASVWGLDLNGKLSMDGDSDDYTETAEGLRISPDAKFAICRVRDLEHAKSVIGALIRLSAVDAVLVDSIAMLTPKEVLEGKDQPAFMARAVGKLVSAINNAQTASWLEEGVDPLMLFTNQYRQNIDVRNPKADNRKVVGGYAVRYANLQSYQVYTRYNQGIDGGYSLEHTIADMTVRVKKDKAGGETNRQGHAKLYLRPWKTGRTSYAAGESSESGKLYEIIKLMGEGDKALDIEPDPRWYEKRKSKHVLLGREFSSVGDMQSFLKREDVQYMLRLPILAKMINSASARAHLDARMYSYSPFLRDDDVLAELLHESKERVGKFGGRPLPQSTEATEAGDDDIFDI